MKLISLNIQGNLHLDTWIPWVQKQSPDILCIQEMYEDAFHITQKELGYEGVYRSTAIVPEHYAGSKKNGTSYLWGDATFSKTKFLSHESLFFAGGAHDMSYRTHETTNRAVIITKIQPAGEGVYCVANTHFTWSDNGLNSDYQRDAWKTLSGILAPYTELIFCGDMNVPRGTALAAEMASSFVDCIPPEIESSLDEKLHRAGHLKRMVDHLLVRGKIRCTSCVLQSGLSDHKGIVATFENY